MMYGKAIPALLFFFILLFITFSLFSQDFVIDGSVLIKYQGDAEEVTIPEGITAIGNDAFFSNRNLKKVTIPEGVTSIGRSAFCYCRNLVSITIPESVTYIGSNAFQSCGSLEIINIPKGITVIREATFMECGSLKSISIPPSVNSIEQGAFSECSSLENITISSNVRSIGIHVFYHCDSLKSVTVIMNPFYSSREGVLFNKAQTFLIQYPGGKPEKEYTIPASVIAVEMEAFSKNSHISKVNIHAGVTRIGNFAFNRCAGLANITVDSQNSVYSSEEGTLFNKNKTVLIQYPAGKPESSYIVPAGVSTIFNYAFSQCKNLTEIIIPEGVTYIGGWSFYECIGLTKVTIPASVKEVDVRAFESCTNLKEVVISRGTATHDAFPRRTEIIYRD